MTLRERDPGIVGGPATSARSVFTATVVRIIPRSFHIKIELDGGCPLVAYATR